jgi:hypothetical protein
LYEGAMAGTGDNSLIDYASIVSKSKADEMESW